MQSLIQKAEKAGMSAEGVSTLRNLVAEYEDVFRLKLGADPPADVKPLVIKLKENVDSTRMSERMYSPPQLAFLRKKIAELERLCLVRKNGSAEWASPPLILPNYCPDIYRMTVDLRVPNASTKAVAWPMPNMQAELQELHGSEVYATLDFCQDYWQIPLHKHSQEFQSFITPDGVDTPSRVLHGTRNATQHLQSILFMVVADRGRASGLYRVGITGTVSHASPFTKWS
jgi:hypothetical protein